jgi:hypothetical protein
MKNKNITNAALQRFIELKAEIKRLESEVDAIKKDLVATGPFETDRFVVDIKSVTKHLTIDADTLCTILDPAFVAQNNLIKQISYPLVQVQPKKAA